MPRNRTALLALAVLALAPSTASAVQLGVEDDSPNAPVVSSAANINGGWVRYITYIDQPGVAQRIRTAHNAGLKVILTVGGTGTRSRRPSFKLALRYISSLPRADRYSIDNEPDIDGTRPCAYRQGWMLARKTLGARLLFGDTSPHGPLDFTAAVRKCGRLPKHVGFAVHPYQWTDPLKPVPIDQGGIGNLKTMRRALHGMGLSVDWWLDEFGYRSLDVTEEQAAFMWPRAIRQAQRNHAKVLIAYLGQHPQWNTHPGALQWCALSRGHYCPADTHRQPVVTMPSVPLREVHAAPTLQEMLAYAG